MIKNLIYKSLLLLKQINFEMNLSYCLSQPANQENLDPQSTKTYTEPRQEKDEATVQHIDATPLKQTNNIEQIRTTHRKLKIKRCCRADTDATLQKTYIQSKNKLKTSPANENSIVIQGNDKKIGTINKQHLKSVSFKIQQCANHHQNSLFKQSENYTNLKPKSRNRSISLSLSKKTVNTSRLTLKDNDHKSSKSKKKIQFTVYQPRKSSKSCERLNQNSHKSLKQFFPSKSGTIPYPCTSNIVIDLFAPQNHKVCSSKSKQKLNLNKDQSLSKKQYSNLNKSLSKDKTNARNQQRIQKTIQKLLKFQIVSDYTQTVQLQGLIKGYILAGQPQCKWVLMTIDEVFKKIKNPINSI